MHRIVLVLIFLFIAASAFAHGGGLDGYGCHHNRKAGGYHCHRGPFAGRSFESKEQMLVALGGAQRTQPARTSK